MKSDKCYVLWDYKLVYEGMLTRCLMVKYVACEKKKKNTFWHKHTMNHVSSLPNLEGKQILVKTMNTLFSC